MIRSVELENFKGHHHTKINFGDSRLAAIVGPNSVGKTSILQAIKLFGSFNDGTIEQLYLKTPEYFVKNIISQGKSSATITIIQDFDSPDVSYKNLEFAIQLSANTAVWDIPLTIEFMDYQLHPINSLTTTTKWFRMRSITDAVSFLKMSLQKLASPSYSEDVAPRMNYDGSVLASSIDHIRNEYPDTYQNLQKLLNQVVPLIKSVRPRRAKINIAGSRTITVEKTKIPIDDSRTVIGEELVFNTIHEQSISAYAVSEGTLLTLGLLTELLQPPQPKVLLLDDIERGLHPTAQRELMSILTQLINENEALQIICTTHSPYIVDELEPSQVWVMNANEAGEIACKRLDKNPETERAMQVLTTGEFWSAEGEEWVQ